MQTDPVRHVIIEKGEVPYPPTDTSGTCIK